MKEKRIIPRITSIILMLCLLFGMLVGCGSTKAETTVSDTTKDAGKMKTFTDSLGREVEVPENLTSVVASGSTAFIYLYAIAPESIMAVNTELTDAANEYLQEELDELPVIGSFFGNHDLNYEEIASLGPQLVIDIGENKPSMESDLEDITNKTGVTAIHIDAYYDNMDETFEMLGELFGKEEEADALAKFCSNSLKLSQDAVDTAQQKNEKKSVLYCTQEDGLNVLAKDSYHSEVIDMLADNLAVVTNPSSKGTGNQEDIEQLLNWDPQVIIFSPDSYYDYAWEDESWQELTAIKNGTYYETPSGPYGWMGSPPASNRVIGMLWMADLLYPEYTDFDLQDMTIEYYKLFYHYDLSDEEYESLVANSIGKRS
ncbi:ABC transporter substrate-binding protein [Eubacterium oxidoreducens]|uniref:Iron complex transport system substrate-binding protein n=1 Tax=Eubacterium oxidoreducens TaxID=1732 RepID=A0A1G6BGM1_EUBOX|nr:ABC transporter substrate-binding protein [Eubacterium oxidoreducens]SDB19771.1 iron complex transport system substrate-binding protein [Eubacterium oxidoreducens]